MKKIVSLTIIGMLLMVSITSHGAIMSPFREGYIEGYIKDISDGYMNIEEYGGMEYRLRVLDDATYYIDDIPASLKDFKIGMEIYAELKGRSILKIEGYSTSNLGYISPGGKMRQGTITSIDRNQITIKNIMGKDETYYFNPTTIIQRNGNNVDATTLYVGDNVIMYFDQINTDVISRMTIQGESIEVEDIYKGRITMVDKLEDVIMLDGVERLENNKWQDLQSSIRISYTTDSPIYLAGYEVSPAKLEYYKGKDVYVAIKGFFGENRIERMVIKDRYESSYSEKIEDINWYTDTFELGNKKNIRFNEGTIIVKSGRLVDKYSVNGNSDVFVVGDGRNGDLVASVINIYNEDINNSNIGQSHLYSGRIDKIFQDSLTLKDFFLLDRNEWESYDDDKELYLDNDTNIYDMEDGEELTLKEFYSGDYAIDEDSDYAEDKRLRDWHGYVYTDGDRVSVVGIQKKMDSLLRQRVTLGVVQSKEIDNLTGETITISNAKDWSERHNQWMAKSVNLKLMIEDSLIIKDNKQTNYNAISPGDRLYIIRDDAKGKVIIVK